MADEKRDPPDTISGGKRRRPPATIDLKATEIASEPVTSPELTESSQESAPAEAPQAAAGVAPEGNAEPREPASGPAAAPKGARSGGWRPQWLDLAAMNDRISALRMGISDRLNVRILAAGVAGAVVTLCVVLGLWALGGLGSRDDRTAALAARVATLESQLRVIAGKPQPAAADPRALADLAARIGAAEQAIGRLSEIDGRVTKAEQGTSHVAALDARLAKLEAAVTALPPAQSDQALADRVVKLEAEQRPPADLEQRLAAATAAVHEAKSRADAAFDAAQKSAAEPAAPPVGRGEIEALAGRVAALEQATKGIDERLARAAANAGADRAGRLAFVALALRSAVDRGEPFGNELAAAKPLVSDPALLAPLEPFAAIGVPRSATLARELSKLTAPMLAAAGTAPAREGGIFDRLQQNAERLVRIRPINETPGDDPATVVSRAEVKAAHGDLAGALGELSHLPDAVRAPAAGWIKQAEAQAAALAAARRLADDAVGGLAK